MILLSHPHSRADPELCSEGFQGPQGDRSVVVDSPWQLPELVDLWRGHFQAR